jgi:hypothetical protein
MIRIEFIAKFMKIVDDICSLKSTHSTFHEKEFDEYK